MRSGEQFNIAARNKRCIEHAEQGKVVGAHWSYRAGYKWPWELGTVQGHPNFSPAWRAHCAWQRWGRDSGVNTALAVGTVPLPSTKPCSAQTEIQR